MTGERGHDLAESVLMIVDLVPPGRVVSYGDVAEIVGCGPRVVGRVMARYGHQTCWWRVTNHAGDLAGGLLAEAKPHWVAEGIEVKPDGLGCRIAHFRADLDQLARDLAERLAALEVSGQDAGA